MASARGVDRPEPDGGRAAGRGRTAGSPEPVRAAAEVRHGRLTDGGGCVPRATQPPGTVVAGAELGGRTAAAPSRAVVMLTLHSCRDRRLGAVVAVHGRTGVAAGELKRLGFSCRDVSGKQADGGPGHVVPHAWVVPKTRWDNDELLRAEVALLMARHNPTPLDELAARQRELEELRCRRSTN